MQQLCFHFSNKIICNYGHGCPHLSIVTARMMKNQHRKRFHFENFIFSFSIL
ncbi:hypothetical protein HMPREF3213_00400 [Heyndrickxia coagulans]|uniref:Uncharacterized protein n=1 Tax=Heyndrickxia coagulans TaxID=1398 RepID=A0A133L196_HEYCO|nr:hypothetical protein HMPREF3213_00400 [Heyndrickxia coagulans]